MTVNVPRWRMAALFPVAVMLFLSSCGDDTSGPLRPDPADADYHAYFYYDEDSLFSFIPIISTKSAEVVDTVDLGTFPNMPMRLNDLQFTPNGSYELLATASSTWELIVVSHLTADTLSRVADRNMSIAVSAEGLYAASYANTFESLHVYTVPDLQQVWSSPDSNVQSVTFLGTTQTVAYTIYGRDSLFIADLTRDPIEVTRLRHPSYSLSHFPRYVISDGIGEYVYTVGTLSREHSSLSYLMVLNQSDFSMADRVDLPQYYGFSRPIVGESGQVVYLRSATGGFESPPVNEEAIPGIMKYDRRTGSLSKFVDYFDDVGYLMNPMDIALTPDDRTLVVVIGLSQNGAGNLLLFDTVTRALTGAVLNHGGGEARMARVYPIARQEKTK